MKKCVTRHLSYVTCHQGQQPKTLPLLIGPLWAGSPRQNPKTFLNPKNLPKLSNIKPSSI